MTRQRPKHAVTPVGFRPAPVLGPFARRMLRREPSPLPVVVETPPLWLVELANLTGTRALVHEQDTYLVVEGYPVGVTLTNRETVARIAAKQRRLAHIAGAPKPRGAAPVPVAAPTPPQTFDAAQVEVPSPTEDDFDMPEPGFLHGYEATGRLGEDQHAIAERNAAANADAGVNVAEV